MRIFKVYEDIILYTITLGLFVIPIYLIGWKSYSDYYTSVYIHMYVVSIIIIILQTLKEVVIFSRIKKMEGKRVNQFSIKFEFLRVVLLIIFFILCWLAIDTIFRSIIVFVPSALRYLLPKIISESIYDTGDGIIYKAKYVMYNSIEEVKMNESDNGINIKVNRKNNNISYFNSVKNKILFEFLCKKVKV